jgi:hypothetical protein
MLAKLQWQYQYHRRPVTATTQRKTITAYTPAIKQAAPTDQSLIQQTAVAGIYLIVEL